MKPNPDWIILSLKSKQMVGSKINIYIEYKRKNKFIQIIFKLNLCLINIIQLSMLSESFEPFFDTGLIASTTCSDLRENKHL